MIGEWQFAINADEIEDEDVMPVEIGKREIAIYRFNDNFYATSDKCTHGDAYLSEGVVVGEVIECPLHQGRFCLKTGKALSAPVSAPIETFEVKLEDGKVFVKLAGS
jgi:naphthalene 1,2-dioxygenase system ferredoxin subunit